MNKITQKQVGRSEQNSFSREKLKNAIANYPNQFSLTLVSAKAAQRKGWQTEQKLSKELILNELFNTRWTGVGLRTGEYSDGLLTLDVDGESAETLLKAIIGSNEPTTVQWTSGSAGKRQILFQVPNNWREALSDFTRKSITKHGETETENGEQLEIRYNKQQSVLPPSHHPKTGLYRWISSPEDTAIAEAPRVLLDYLWENHLKPKPEKAKESEKPASSDTFPSGEDSSRLPVSSTVPLKETLPQDKQTFVNHGCPNGQRNDLGNEIGILLDDITGHLEEVGQAYSGDAEDILYDFFSACNYDETLAKKRASEITKSCHNSGKGLTEDMKQIIENQILAFHYGVNNDPYFISPEIKSKVEEIVYSRFFEGNYIRLHQVVYKYTELGYWRALSDEKVKKEIFNILKNLYSLDDYGKKVYRYSSDRYNKECYSYIMVGIVPTDELEREIERKPALLCFKNGTLNTETGEFREHRKNDYLTLFLPYEYNPKATLGDDSAFLKFLNTSFGKEQIPLIRAVTQMLINPACPYGKFPHIKGASGSGKGTLLEIWASLFPEEVTQEIANFSLLSDPDKVHQNLKNKKFIYNADASAYMSEPNTFYNLVQNDRVAGRALHSSETYSKRWNVRLAIASTNHLKIENAGAGWQRRCIPITTKGAIQAKDYYLWDKLKQEKSKIIAWALSMPDEERDRLLFTTDYWSEKTKDDLREQETHADPIAGFIDDCLLPLDDGEGETISKNDLYKAYCAYCDSQGINKPAQKNTFINRMKNRIPNHFQEKYSKRVDNKVKKIPSYFHHIKFACQQLFHGFPERNHVFINSNKIVGGGLEVFDSWVHPDLRETQPEPQKDKPVRCGDDQGVSKSETSSPSQHENRPSQSASSGDSDQGISQSETSNSSQHENHLSQSEFLPELQNHLPPLFGDEN